MPDFLGFGASDKPADHDYSLLEQADLVEALWAQRGRRGDGARRPRLRGLGRAGAARAPRRGPARASSCAALHAAERRRSTRTSTGRSRSRRRCSTPSRARRSARWSPRSCSSAGLRADVRRALRRAADSAEMWRANSRDDGQLIAHRLIRYIVDRREHEQRWVTRSSDRRAARASSGGCSTRSPARTWPSGSPSACRTRRCSRSTTSATGRCSRRRAIAACSRLIRKP